MLVLTISCHVISLVNHFFQNRAHWIETQNQIFYIPMNDTTGVHMRQRWYYLFHEPPRRSFIQSPSDLLMNKTSKIVPRHQFRDQTAQRPILKPEEINFKLWVVFLQQWAIESWLKATWEASNRKKWRVADVKWNEEFNTVSGGNRDEKHKKKITFT